MFQVAIAHLWPTKTHSEICYEPASYKRDSEGYVTDPLRCVTIKAARPYVRFGSLADIRKRIRDVRFTPKSGHAQRRHRCLLSANSGHSGRMFGRTWYSVACLNAPSDAGARSRS